MWPQPVFAGRLQDRPVPANQKVLSLNYTHPQTSDTAPACSEKTITIGLSTNVAILFHVSSMGKPVILILCTGNSCRSHLAEGVLRSAVDESVEIASAGSSPAGYVHPVAVEVMAEIGIDITGHTSKHLNEFLEKDVRTVITVCDNADQVCPMFPGQIEKNHWPFDDPAKIEGSEEEIRTGFRRVRDEIRGKFEAYAQELKV